MDRKKICLMTFAMLLLGFFTTTFAAEQSISPVGYWKTIDDVTGRPKSIVRIWQAQNQELMGEVIKIFPKHGNDQHKICTACQGNLRNQPIVGLVILSGLKSAKEQWNSGKILDPENGKTYSCSVRLTDHGKKLNVHGFIGLPLFGRSQSWERVDLMSG